MKADDRLKTQDSRRRTSDMRHETSDSRLQMTDLRFQTRISSLKSQVSSLLSLVTRYSLLSFILLLLASSSFAQSRQEEDQQPVAEPYHESALRRFEIVFTISLPFTALHSYLVVRGVEGIRQRKIAPELESSDWNMIGGLTILFSGFVAFWDWLHVRDEDISEKMPVPRGGTVPYSGYSMPYIRYPASTIHHPAIISLSARF